MLYLFLVQDKTTPILVVELMRPLEMFELQWNNQTGGGSGSNLQHAGGLIPGGLARMEAWLIGKKWRNTWPVFVIMTRTFRTSSVAVKYRFHQPNSPWTSFRTHIAGYAKNIATFWHQNYQDVQDHPTNLENVPSTSIHFQSYHLHLLPSSGFESAHWQDHLDDSTKVGFWVHRNIIEVRLGRAVRVSLVVLVAAHVILDDFWILESVAGNVWNYLDMFRRFASRLWEIETWIWYITWNLRPASGLSESKNI